MPFFFRSSSTTREATRGKPRSYATASRQRPKVAHKNNHNGPSPRFTQHYYSLRPRRNILSISPSMVLWLLGSTATWSPGMIIPLVLDATFSCWRLSDKQNYWIVAEIFPRPSIYITREVVNFISRQCPIKLKNIPYLGMIKYEFSIVNFFHKETVISSHILGHLRRECVPWY